MRPRGILATLTILQALAAPTAQAQWDVIPKASLPAWPLWWQTPYRSDVSAIPLLWTNDVDGAEEGCCVLGAAARYRAGPATVWLGLGFGTDPDAGSPAAFEAAAEIDGAALAFRRLHGRSGLSLFFPLIERDGREAAPARLSAGVSASWIYDERYVPILPLFECPVEAPAAPCRRMTVSRAWDAGRDYAVGLEGRLGDGSGAAPRLSMSVLAGLKLLDGDHDYLRVEVEGEREGAFGETLWALRLAAGWASGDAPLQRRFHLDGGDPIRRWLNPYVDARGAVLEDAPYHTPGGAGLRAYEETRPLVKRYLAGRGEVTRAGYTRMGFWGTVSAFLEGAWTPDLPDRFGPDGFDRTSPLLFDWQELPLGEGEARGEFMARVLEISEFWADAGLAFTGGYEGVAITLAVPFWVSEPALANDPFRGEETKSFALRWSLEVAFRHAPVPTD